ncbi:hypothetical protein [Kocuria palustris]|uniref:hypothetical protein n=1 Tax=Kocuria palustris TaxID=71999 RepID=UPI003D73A6BF
MNTLTTSAITSISAATAPGGGGEDVFSYIDNLASDTQSTIGSILVVVGIIVALMISVQKRTFGGVIIGIAVGGAIAALGGIVVAFSGVFEQTATPNAASETAIVQQVEPESLEL